MLPDFVTSQSRSLVPTLCVGMRDALRPRFCSDALIGRGASGLHSHAERGNEVTRGLPKIRYNQSFFFLLFCHDY
ncbi:MAG: hypothetical protein GY749_07815 [Desulfobacteraceae bacterium]|nr:hypothetical protein [Desulfobacteraceae bacterium]